jgi:hypothetical protein
MKLHTKINSKWIKDLDGLENVRPQKKNREGS